MVTLKQLFHAFSSELLEASASADALSAEYAEAYHKNEILKEQDAPRFKIAEIEFDFPVTVENLDLAERASLEFSQLTYEDFLEGAITNWFQDTTNSIAALSPTKRVVIPATAEVKNMYRNLMEEFKTHAAVGPLEALIDKNVKRVVIEVVKHNELQRLYQQKDPNENLLHTAIAKQLKHKLESSLIVKKDKLKELSINPLTQAVKGVNSNQSVFRVRVKMNGDGVMLTDSIDRDGNPAKTLI